MPAMIVWPVSSSVRDLERRVLLGRAAGSPVPSFSWSPLVFGSMATWMTGRREASSTRGRPGASGPESVSPVVVSLSPITATIWPALDRRDLLALVRVHPVDLADPLLAALDAS